MRELSSSAAAAAAADDETAVSTGLRVAVGGDEGEGPEPLRVALAAFRAALCHGREDRC